METSKMGVGFSMSLMLSHDFPLDSHSESTVQYDHGTPLDPQGALYSLPGCQFSYPMEYWGNKGRPRKFPLLLL